MARCFFAIAILLATAGCPAPTAPTAPSTNSLKRVEVTLRVALVGGASEEGAEGDAPLLRAIERLRGEWNERTGGGIEVTTVVDTDLKTVCNDNDLVIFPSRWLGELCEAGRIRPMRRSALSSESLRLDDLLPLVRDVEIRYGNQVMALPLGCPTPLVLRPVGEENARLAIPTDDRRLAIAYLAWAASHVAHRSQLALLFDAETFAPRLAMPPFIRALERFAEAVTVENSATGRIVWPERSRKDEGDWNITSPPGATESFNPIARIWEPLGTAPAKATLIASSGRLLAVTTASRNATTAFRYAAWLAGAENARQISTAGNGVAICRGSLARSTDDWLGTSDREQRVHRCDSALLHRTLRFSCFSSLSWLKSLPREICQALLLAIRTENNCWNDPGVGALWATQKKKLASNNSLNKNQSPSDHRHTQRHEVPSEQRQSAPFDPADQ